MTMKLKVGQEVFLQVHTHRYGESGSLRPTHVTKVGRKWIQVPGYRFDAETFFLDGGEYSSPGRAWLARSDYEQHEENLRVWSKFKDSIQRMPAPAAWRVREAASALNLTIPGVNVGT